MMCLSNVCEQNYELFLFQAVSMPHSIQQEMPCFYFLNSFMMAPIKHNLFITVRLDRFKKLFFIFLPPVL